MSDLESLRLQVCETLKTRYFPMILPMPGNHKPEDREKNRLSRALAALAIEKLADVSPAQAAYAVVDGGNDNGLDAIHFDRPGNILSGWLACGQGKGPGKRPECLLVWE